MKFNVSMDDDLFNELEEFGKEMHLNRSAIISLSIQQYMDAQRKIPTLKNQLDELKTFIPVFNDGIEVIKDALTGVQAK